jgi:hypothetical protein
MPSSPSHSFGAAGPKLLRGEPAEEIDRLLGDVRDMALVVERVCLENEEGLDEA